MKSFSAFISIAIFTFSNVAIAEENKTMIYKTSFEDFGVGAINEHTDGDVTWISKDKSEITSKYHHTGSRCLHMFGGTDNTLELTLTGNARSCRGITFKAERWTAGNPFKFRIMAEINNAWEEIANLDNEIITGRRFLSDVMVKMPEDAIITGLRLICSAPRNAGILIDDFALLKKLPVSYDRSVENYVNSEVCDPTKPGLLPIPQKIHWENRAIALSQVRISFPSNADRTKTTHIKRELKRLLFDNKLTVNDYAAQKIIFKLAEVDVPGYWAGQEKEAYELLATESGITITANNISGLYYGLQTLRQLIVRKDGRTTVAACKITDFPAFKIRGFMHDVGRNFQSIEQLKMQIDVMAAYKMNIFHFHLTEYHGWRLESKIYPNLQADSSFTRKPGKFYTQEEFVELVNYCQVRGITIIPEFDSPGHSDAFLKGIGIKNMKDPKALKAIVALINELCSLVPKEKMPYVHVGTDEVRKAHQRVNNDYLPTLHRAVEDNGREVIGWWKGMTFRGAKQVFQTWAQFSPAGGAKHIDSRSNYVNHMEALDFGVRMFFQQPCRVPHGDETQLGGILCLWPDTKVDDEKLILTNNPVIPAMVGYSEAVWRGIPSNRNAYWAKMPDIGTPEYRAYADFENRLIQQRDRFLSYLPFPMVKTHHIEWRLLGPVADGELPALEKAIIRNSYNIWDEVINWSEPVYGGAIHLRHFFGFGGHLSNLPKGKDIVWANTNIYSSKEQEVDAWISFNTISSSDSRAGTAKNGNWAANPKCNIWINGKRIAPPRWKNPGVLNNEIALIDNVYTSRAPTKIKLKKGWNTVLVKSAQTWKWVFSFSPVERKNKSWREVQGLVFSSEIDDRKLVGLVPNIVVPPRVVAVPPADAGRGLIRVSEKEIRHYPGKGGKNLLRSLDNGETWQSVKLPSSYPGATCLAKESPAIAQNPLTGEFIRFEPLYRGNNNNDGVYITEGGIDGAWKLLRDRNGNSVRPGGILRNPLWVNKNKRIIIPAHGGGCWTWYSDNQGLSWKRSNKVQSPHHKPGGVHKGTRWNHGMVEATVIELKNRKLWMIARTAQDQHYQSFSRDFGKTWSKAEPSRFFGTITMPTLHRLDDGRILFLWSNTTPLPERDTATGRGEDAFTNRDTIHAAISEDEGKTWIGFRELILDEHRNRKDYGTYHGHEDRGKHQAEVLQLDENRVLYSCGQHAMHRRLMIMDLRWLYEKERRSDLDRDGTKDWTTHQFIQKYVGHCSYNRTPGAQVKKGALRLYRVANAKLTNPNQGATWNFPAGDAGSLTATVRLELGGSGLQIALCNRWFSACDPTVNQFANYVLNIDAQGKVNGRKLMTPGKKHKLTIDWKNVGRKGRALLSIDGKKTGITLRCKHATPNGISYVHFYNPATRADTNGSSIFKTHVRVK